MNLFRSFVVFMCLASSAFCETESSSATPASQSLTREDMRFIAGRLKLDNGQTPEKLRLLEVLGYHPESLGMFLEVVAQEWSEADRKFASQWAEHAHREIRRSPVSFGFSGSIRTALVLPAMFNFRSALYSIYSGEPSLIHGHLGQLTLILGLFMTSIAIYSDIRTFRAERPHQLDYRANVEATHRVLGLLKKGGPPQIPLLETRANSDSDMELQLKGQIEGWLARHPSEGIDSLLRTSYQLEAQTIQNHLRGVSPTRLYYLHWTAIAIGSAIFSYVASIGGSPIPFDSALESFVRRNETAILSMIGGSVVATFALNLFAFPRHQTKILSGWQSPISMNGADWLWLRRLIIQSKAGTSVDGDIENISAADLVQRMAGLIQLTAKDHRLTPTRLQTKLKNACHAGLKKIFDLKARLQASSGRYLNARDRAAPLDRETER